MNELDRTDHRPQDSIGGGLQHERTALAWERTAIATMVIGVALARFASSEGPPALGSVGIATTVAGGMLLLWASRNHALLHDPARPASAVPQVELARLVGVAAVAVTGGAFVLAVVFSLV